MEHPNQNLTGDEINDLLEQGESLQAEMDESTLITCIRNLQDKISLNSKLRTRYTDDISKYLESEIDLHEEIKVLQRIAAYPNLIDTFISKNGIQILIELLSHENIDIVDDAVVLIEEITDGDYLIEVSNPKEFLELFISAGLFDSLVSNLIRINEEEDEQAVSDILSVLENFTDIYPYAVKILSEKTKILSWLLNRIRTDEINKPNNRLFASEMLYTLAQSSSEVQIALAEKEAIPHLLMILIKHKSIGDSTEEEFVLNIVNIISTCMFVKENQTIFRNSDGVGIILSMLKENNIYRHAGIKILDFAIQNNAKNAALLIKSDGLAVVFSFFMGKGLGLGSGSGGLNKKKRFESLCGEEHCIGILTSLFKYLTGVEMDRLVFKFKENNCEKCERLVEFYKKYEREYKLMINKTHDSDNEESSELTSNSSLFNLQNISIMIAALLARNNKFIRSHLEKLLSINNVSIDMIKENLRRIISQLGEEDEGELNGNNNKAGINVENDDINEEFSTNKNYIQKLIRKI